MAVELAAAGREPTATSIGGWIARTAAAAALKPNEGRLPASALGEPSRLARALGFLDDTNRCTDLGNALHLAEAWTDGKGKGKSLFVHPPPIRWILWFASARADRALWRAALAEWSEGIGTYDWLLATAAHLGPRGAGILAGILEGLVADQPASRQARAHASKHYGRPWLGQLEILGWSERRPQLREWARSSPDPWTAQDVWRAFGVAEDINEVSRATLHDLQDLLTGLPPSLLGLDGREAAASTIQICGAARALASGVPQDWYGESWAALLSRAREVGIFQKSGSEAGSPNLTWSLAALAPERAEISSSAAAPVGPLRGRPALMAPTRRPEDERARSCFRALAWWARGRTAGDLLASGHDSWRLLRWTLEHWLRPPEFRRWQSRAAAVGLGKRKVKWLVDALAAFDETVPSRARRFLESQASSSTWGLETLEAAAGWLPPLDRRRIVEEIITPWIESGAGDWARVERASVSWAASGIESGLFAVEDLRAGLIGRAQHGTAAELDALLGQLSAQVSASFRVHGRLAVCGAVSDAALEALTSDELEFRRLDEPIAPFEIVEFWMPASGFTVHAVEAQCLARARTTLQGALPGLRVMKPQQAAAIYKDDKLIDPSTLGRIPAEAGVGGWWRTSDWLRPPRADPIIDEGWSEREAAELRRSRQHEAAAERLLGLWVALEHSRDQGETGRSFIEILSRAATEVVANELRTDVREIARLCGHDAPPHTTWSAWSRWRWEPRCVWARSRVNRLQAALSDREALGRLQRDAAGHSAWLLSAMFSVRNRRVHEAFMADERDEPMLQRLDEACFVLVNALLRGRGEGWWRGSALVAALTADADDDGMATLLDELGSR